MSRLYSWTRDAHLLCGIFLSPFIVLFAASTLWMNHPPTAGPEAARSLRHQPVRIPAGAGTLEQARDILNQLGVTGEIDHVRHLPGEQRLAIPVTKPGELIRVDVNLASGLASVEVQPQGLGSTLAYLHKMPGPHNANIRGNWIFTTWWAVFADATVGLLVLVTASGIYLWWVVRKERKAGWGLLAAGALCLLLALVSVTGLS
jgi:hypothetical protein